MITRITGSGPGDRSLGDLRDEDAACDRAADPGGVDLPLHRLPFRSPPWPRPSTWWASASATRIGSDHPAAESSARATT
ncbi:hypothetical protein ACRAWD_03540 [Caulobacter segnis]